MFIDFRGASERADGRHAGRHTRDVGFHVGERVESEPVVNGFHACEEDAEADDGNGDGDGEESGHQRGGAELATATREGKVLEDEDHGDEDWRRGVR